MTKQSCCAQRHPASVKKALGHEHWCASNSQCISCPQSYRNDPESELLCSLWTELQMTNHDIDTGKLTMPTSLQNMTCKYSNHPTSSENLCTVWCELQLGRGSKSDLYCRLFCLIHSFILFLEPVLSLFTLTPSITEGFPVCILSWWIFKRFGIWNIM